MLQQVLFAQANTFRGHFNQLVIVDEFQCLFQRHTDGRCQQNILVTARGADIRELLGLEWIDHQVIVA